MEAAVLFFRFRRNGTTIAPTVLVICRFDCYLVAKLRSVHKVYIEVLVYENDTRQYSILIEQPSCEVQLSWYSFLLVYPYTST